MYDYTLGYSPYTVDPALTSSGSGSMLTRSSGPRVGTAGIGLAASVGGALQSVIGGIYTAKSIKDNYEFQAKMNTINARLAENTAQSILRAGESQIGKVTMKAGQVESAQKVGQAGRGITIGQGSAAEETASTNLVKELDMNTIYENAVNASNAARMQSVNYSNASLIEGASARSINPYLTGTTSLITAGTTVASTWYKNKRSDELAAALGLD